MLSRVPSAVSAGTPDTSGPEFIIQRVIAAEGGWVDAGSNAEVELLGAKKTKAEAKREASARSASQMPDEGLPMVRPAVLAHLEKDQEFDPASVALLATIDAYGVMKQGLHDSVKFMLSHPKNNTKANYELAKQRRAETEIKWQGLAEEFDRKVADDALLTSFDEGQRFFIKLIRAENLPMFDQFNAFDPYCTVTQRPVHLATPETDGRKTFCRECNGKSAFSQESCALHKSDWVANSQSPEWNKKITVQLDAGAAEIVLAVYSSGSRGAKHDLIGWCHVPSARCLYREAVIRTYPLLRADGSPLITKVEDPIQGWCQKQGLLTVSWRVRVPPKLVGASGRVFIEVGTPITRKLNGTYTKRWVGGSAYYGSWQDGLPHGTGKFISEEGTEYQGEWTWGKMHGQGSFKYSNGDLYIGSFKDNLRHGQGTCKARNGDVYVGEWRFGFQHGVGVHTTVDGVVYEGEWKNNKAHGVGLVTELDGNGGTLKWDGIFHEGLLLQRNEARPPTPRTIHAETLHLVESVPVGIGHPERAMHSISSLVHSQAVDKKYVVEPHVHKDSWHLVKAYPGDKARYDEDPRQLHRSFFQRHRHQLATTPMPTLTIRREEREVDERLLRRETEKDKIKMQKAREAAASAALTADAETPGRQSGVCAVC